MDVEVQGTAEALDDGHDAALPVPRTPAVGAPAMERQERSDVDAEHGAGELVVPREEIAEAERQGEHPLPYRHTREHGVDEVRRLRGHPPPAAARAEPAALARERDEPLERAVATPDAREAARQDAAGEELAQLALDEVGEASAVVAKGRLAQELLEVIADDPMQELRLSHARLIAVGRHGRRKKHGMPGLMSRQSAGLPHPAQRIVKRRAADRMWHRLESPLDKPATFA